MEVSDVGCSNVAPNKFFEMIIMADVYTLTERNIIITTSKSKTNVLG